MLDNRIHLLKSAARLSHPYDNFVVYDRDGFLGLRFLATHGGLTDAGVELDLTYPIPLGGKTPETTYQQRTTAGRLPEIGRILEREAPVEPSCGAREPAWEVGSRDEFIADLRVVAEMTIRRFLPDFSRGALMLWVMTKNRSRNPRICLERSEVCPTGQMNQLADNELAWLLEDIARLSPGLFSRNLPAGCCQSPGGERVHTHDSARFVILVDRRASTGHELIAGATRYQEIIEASETRP